MGDVVTATLVTCAVVVTALVVRREVWGPLADSNPQKREEKSVFISPWHDFIGKGVQIGPLAAPVQLIEFADFECTFCGTFHNTLNTLRERYPNQIALYFVHFPLSNHRFAVPAARVAECAAEQGRFEAIYDRLFEDQQSFGLKPWGEFAKSANVPDATTFDACIKRTGPMPRIAQGLQLGEALSIRGTPTVILNGWKLARTPNVEELDAMVRAVLAGRDPIPADGMIGR